MRNYAFAIIIASLAFSSCCTKKACVEMAGVPLKFYGFTLAELDTIYTTGYAPGSYFAQVTRPEQIDSVQRDYDSPGVFHLNIDGNYTLSPHAGGSTLSDEHEWKIFIPAVNKTILISNYGYRTYTCNKCAFSKNEKTRSLSTCTINGKTESVHDIRIYK